ncbi:MAG: hypothetical protein RLZZ319_35, partial [Actinomycetota bacterium]
MVRSVVTILILGVALAFPAPAVAVSCSGAALASGTCSVGGGTTGGGVDLWGDLTDGGGGSTGGTADPNECPHPVGDRCLGESPPKDVSRPTTVHDIASFRPEHPTQFSEPLGWTLRGIPTNFVSVAARHVVSGELLGNDADVRFTPVSYARRFGDGSSQSTRSAGDTWSHLGQPWWTRTATSHVYANPDVVTVTLTVWFEAEYRFGNQDWQPL